VYGLKPGKSKTIEKENPEIWRYYQAAVRTPS
jgi:hypothetical protein